ncbi:MAG: S9 family peptidase [Rhodothermales bacterium]|nr:S9 family peptidase [Rhodothermales bacterium]MBO6781118.1 S9 family peptidase [Rhodothermales bacterium]
MRSLLPCLLGLLIAQPTLSQERRALDHSDYQLWKSISDQRLSPDGRWAAWREAPDTVGDGLVHIARTDGSDSHIVARGDNPMFADGYVAVLVHPPYDSTRQARIDGKKGQGLPEDSLAVVRLSDGSRSLFGPVRSYRVAEDGARHVAILLDTESETTRDSTAEDAPHDKQDGRDLLLLDAASGETRTYASVIDYHLTADGAWLVYAAETKDGTGDGVFAVNTGSGDSFTLASGEGFFRQLTLSDDGQLAGFVSNSADFTAEQPEFSVFVSELPGEAESIVDGDSPALPDGWWISEHAGLDFSDSGNRLFFGAAPRPEIEEEDSRPDDEKVDVDIWSWTDKDLMTVQLVNAQRERRRSYTMVYHREEGSLAQLADPLIRTVDDLEHGDGSVVIGTTNLPYMPDGSWDTPSHRDVYVIDVSDGSRTRVLEGIRSNPLPSPDGTHLAWWDGAERTWKITSWSTQPQSTITTPVTVPEGVRLDNVLHDSPMLPGSYGSPGWTDDGRWFLFNGQFDIWAAQPNGRTWNVTGGAGAAQERRLRIVELDPDADTVDLAEPLLLSVFDYGDKSAGFARAEIRGSTSTIRELVHAPARFSSIRKAPDADVLILSRESYTEFPDIWATGSRFEDWTRLSDANPQQSEYRWGTAELTHWTSADGEQLSGILYKPEGFNPSQQYPLMTYFYEKSSDGLHSYHTPAPGRSVINRSFYTSRGYVVFVPDIPYKDGYPGESAMNAVMPGVTGLIDQGFIDRDRVGVQGHSWGGYQIAYMVTRTNLFAAAEAGAPVANMFSAYGGIRWQTGLSRMFQYERTQSRIGGTIWEKPLRYIENSPLFWLDKVETPLLIMHNDADGHVPWYQGIELFVALRRLGKPAWLINYNNEPHWPLPYWKRMDWTMRMQQFFDHYLMDAPAPVWLNEGVPAVRKGEDWGFELPAAGDRGR